MARCDLCSKVCKMSDMTELMPQYKVDSVSDICSACAMWANALKSEIINEVAPQMRAAISAKKGSYPAPTRPGQRLAWWKRVVRVVLK